MNSTELQRLIDSALDGDISEADFVRLEAELSVDASARRDYFDCVLLTSLLEAEAAASGDKLPLPRTRRERHAGSGIRWRTAFSAMVAVCAVLLLVVIWQWREGPLQANANPQHSAPRLTHTGEEQQSSGYAILSGQSEADWETESPLAPGSIVPPGELHLKSGLAQFELFSGVTLVVEGDARFSILSPTEVAVTGGKVRARVPEPAQGFRLLTQAGEVVDLGTEFAVDVSDERAEVHVIEGEVEWHPRGAPVQQLQQGHAARSTEPGQTSLITAADQFVGATELRQRIRTRQQSRYEQWQQASDELTHDPRLIAHYSLSTDSVAERRLPNLAGEAWRTASEGAVVAATPAANRWGVPASALDFSPAGSRVRLHVPGEYQNLTLICWVRINSLDRWYNSLFLTDGHEQGEPHWQIMDDGRLFFSVKRHDQWDPSKGEKDKHVFYSPPFWDASLSGRWLMIATVYDGTQREVTHYLNGEVLSREAIPEEYLVDRIRIGDASLCNWDLPERNQPRFAIRNLNGSLDEFLMFAAPLAEAEIRRLNDVGHP